MPLYWKLGRRGAGWGEESTRWSWGSCFKVKHSSVHCRLSLSQSSGLVTGRPKQSALGEIWLKSVNRQTNRWTENCQGSSPSSSVNNSLAYNYIVGGEGNNLAQPLVMASTTQPQILPKEGDSFFSSLWNWFKWPFKTDLVSIALLKGSHANCDLSVHLSCFFSPFSSRSLFLLPPFIYLFIFLDSGPSKKKPLPVIFRKTLFSFGYVKIQ